MSRGKGHALAIGIAALVVAACTPQRDPGVIVLASGADLESANPLVTTHPLSRQLQRYALFVTLLRYDSTLTPQPYFARSWSWTDAGRTLTLSLVHDLRWHDGVPTTSRDAAFTFLAARDPATGFPRAAELATHALRHPPETRSLPLAVSDEGAATLVIDLARYHSIYAAALSTAINHGGPRRRGRRPPTSRARGRDPVAAAHAYGVDVSLLRAALARTLVERLARLDANAGFLSGLRRLPAVSSHASPSRRGGRRRA